MVVFNKAMLLFSSVETILILGCSFFGINCSIFNGPHEPKNIRNSPQNLSYFLLYDLLRRHVAWLITLCTCTPSAWNILSLHSHVVYPFTFPECLLGEVFLDHSIGNWSRNKTTPSSPTLSYPSLCLFSCLALMPLNIPYYFSLMSRSFATCILAMEDKITGWQSGFISLRTHGVPWAGLMYRS